MARTKGATNKAKPKKGAKKGARAAFKAPVNTKTGAAGDDAAKSAAAATAAKAAEKPFISKERMTPGTFLKSLLNTCLGFKSNVDSIVGKIREEIGYGKEKKNLHTGVFAWLRKMHAMVQKNPEKAAEWHYTYLHYLESSGVLAKIEAVQRLPLGDQPQVAGEGGADDEDADETGGEAGEAAEAAAAAAAQAGGAGAPAPTEGQAGEAPAGNGTPPDDGKVTRPRFGQSSAPKSQSAKAEEARLAASGGSTAKH